MSVNPIKPPKGAVKKKKIVGRGDSAGKGSTCGRGHKGQKARSGGNVRPGFEGGQMPLYRRVARRGFSNYPFKKTYITLNILVLEKHFKDGETVSLGTLKEKKIVRNNAQYIKILGNDEITKKLVIEDLKISKSAKEAVEKAGGSVKEPAAGKTAEKGAAEDSTIKESAPVQEKGEQKSNDTNDKEGQE